MPPLLRDKKEIEKWLNHMGIKHYNLVPDKKYGFVVNVNDSVDLRAKELNALPVKFNSIMGSFYISYNKLTSLTGCPETVLGWFDCQHNELTSLKGAPHTVEDFICSKNKLTSLKYGPKNVGGSYECPFNLLSNLVGAPRDVDGAFDCQYNQLVSLKGAPKLVQAAFYCSHNLLTNLQYCPQYIYGDFLSENNQLKNLAYFPKEVGHGGNVFLKNNPQLGSLQTLEIFADLFPHHKRQEQEAKIIAEKNKIETALLTVDKQKKKIAVGFKI